MGRQEDYGRRKEGNTLKPALSMYRSVMSAA